MLNIIIDTVNNKSCLTLGWPALFVPPNYMIHCEDLSQPGSE